MIQDESKLRFTFGQLSKMFTFPWHTFTFSCESKLELWNREVGKSLKIGKNRKKSDKIGKIGFDFLLDFLAKMPKCHKMP